MIKLLAFLSGVIWLCTSTQLLPLYDLFWITGFSLLACWLGLRRYQLLNFPGLFGLGLVLASLSAYFHLHTVLVDELDAKRFIVKGRVIGLPDSDNRKQSFQLRTEYIRLVDRKTPLPKPWPNTLKLALYHGPYGSNAQTAAVLLSPGMMLELEVVLKRPRGLLNPAGFDYQAFLLSRGIDATGYVRKLISQQTVAATGWRWQVKQRLKNSGLVHQRFMTGLLIGDRSELDKGDWQILQATGTSHLLAISGLHIGLIAGFGFILGGGIGRLCLLLPRAFLPAKVWAIVFSIGFALFYAYLAGFSLPTQRALIMLVLVQGFYLWARPVGVFSVFLLALIFILLLDPFAMAQLGMNLSFAAVLALLYGFVGRKAKYEQAENNGAITVKNYLLGFTKSQALVMGFSIAVLFSLSLPFSVLAPLANVIAIPILGVVLMPSLFLGLLEQWLLGSQFFWGCSDFILYCLLQFLQFIQSWGGNLVWPPVPWSPLWFLLFSAAFFFLFLPKGLPGRYLSLLLPLLLLWPGEALKPRRDLSITVMDVGQGLAVVIDKNQRALIYDTGPYFSADFNAGTHIISPFLRRKGISAIDKLWVSHSDRDHSGGMLSLLKEFPTRQLVLERGHRQEFTQFTRDKNDQAGICQAGQVWYWQGLEIEALWPISNLPQDKNNNRSCVLLLRYGDFWMLLPGDIEQQAEAYLLQVPQGDILSVRTVDILIAPHHGSKTSSSAEWVGTLRPLWLISSAAYKNRYRHPNKEVIQRYQSTGSETLNTAEHGAITITVKPDGSYQLDSARRRRSVFYR